MRGKVVKSQEQEADEAADIFYSFYLFYLFLHFTMWGTLHPDLLLKQSRTMSRSTFWRWFFKRDFVARGPRRRRIRVERLEDRSLLAADLSITKDDVPDEVLAGEELFYNIHVHNFGPDLAANVVVTDTLPTGLVYLGNTNPGGCVQVGNTLSCDLGNMPDGSNRDFTVKTRVPADFLIKKDVNINEVQTITLSGGSPADLFLLTFVGQQTAPIAQTATAAQVQTALEGLSNIAPGDVVVAGAAGGPYTVTFQGALAAQNVPQITGVGFPTVVVTVVTTTPGNDGGNEVQSVALSGGGGADTFTLAFDNDQTGPQTTGAIAQTATAAQVQTALEALSNIAPGDVVVAGAAGGPYSVFFQGTLARKNVAQMTGAGSGTLGVAVETVTQGSPTGDGSFSITNTATVTSTNAAADPDLSDNTVTELTFVGERADLVVTKFVEPTNTIRAGEIFVYTIWVDNLGPSAARNVLINDTLLNSDSVSVQSCAFSVSQGGGAITQFTCTTGEVVGTQFGSDIGTFSTNVLLPVGADPDPTSGNKPFGRLRASFRLVVTDSEGGAGNTHGGDTTVTNTTRVTSPTPDSNTSNNVSIVDITVTPVADLQAFSVFSAEVHVAGQPSTIINTNSLPPLPEAPFYNFGGTTVTAGRRIQWDSSVLNAGPSAADNVKIEVLLPFGTSLIENTLTGAPNPASSSVVAGRCFSEPAGEIRNKVICEYGTLKGPLGSGGTATPGQTGALRFQLLVDIGLPAGTQLSIDAIASSEMFEPNNSNNVTSIQFDTNVDDAAIGLTKPDLVITKDAPPTAEPGQEITFVINVSNAGLVNAPEVVVQDFLPVGLFPISYTPSTGSCLAGVPGNALRPTTCSLGTLGPGLSGQIIVVAKVGNAVKDLTNLFNDVIVVSSAADKNSADNAAHSVTTVLQSANGNVKAEVRNGTLFITGDKFNNKLRIEDASAAAPQAFRIVPLGGTKLNGKFDSFQVHGVKGNVFSFTMGDGNDTLLFEGPLTLPKGMTLLLGNGSDSVQLTGATVKGNVLIQGGVGMDSVAIIDSLITGKLELLLGTNDDSVDLLGSRINGLTIIAVDGGNDTVNIVDSILVAKLDLRTGIGKDVVTIDGSRFKKAATIKNDNNDDLVTVLDSIFEDAVSFLGGKGFDTLDANPITRNNSFAKKPVIKSFESILP